MYRIKMFNLIYVEGQKNIRARTFPVLLIRLTEESDSLVSSLPKVFEEVSLRLVQKGDPKKYCVNGEHSSKYSIN